LPGVPGRGSQECDEHIGRLCLFGGDLDWEPKTEDPRLQAAREELLKVLEEIGIQIPGDRWVMGQRVRYLGDTGRWAEAEKLARGCSSTGWWCHGLLGYVLHRAGKTLDALEAFERALGGMDPEEAEEWTDPEVLLDYPERGWLDNPENLSPSQAKDRFWTLADPLFLTPGNERFSEHLSRRFGFYLFDKTALTMRMRWGGAFEQLLLRYGFVAGWERVEGMGPGGNNGSVVEHHHPEIRGLLPPLDALRNPADLPEGTWVPVDDRPRSASAPIWAPVVAQGRAQTAVMRRDGGLLILGSYGIPEDTVLHRRRDAGIGSYDSAGEPLGRPNSGDADGVGPFRRPLWEPSLAGFSSDTLAGLFLFPADWGGEPLSVRGVGGEGVLQITVPPGGYLLSLEQWAPEERWGARVRHGIKGEAIPPDVPHLSDLLILDTGSRLPDSLPEALPRLRASTEVPEEGVITVAWEVYGLGLRSEPLTFRLSLLKPKGSMVRRALNRIGLLRRDPALTLSWEEEGASDLGPLFRAVDVELPRLDAGRYILRLELGIPYRNPVISDRFIWVR
jgi:hypothetical protein